MDRIEKEKKNIKTFNISRSNILINILKKNNFIEKTSGKVDFSYNFNHKNIESKINVISKVITNKFDNKKNLYLEMKKNGISKYHPRTIVNIKDFINNNEENNKTYYLKNIYLSGGKDIHLIRTKEDILKLNLSNYNNWILQEEVNDLYLIDNKKVTYRVYLVISDKKEFFLYKEGLGIINTKEFEKDSLDYDVKVNHKKSSYVKLSDNKNYNFIIKKIRDICYLSLYPFLYEKEINKNNFIILGIDFLVTNKLDLFLIEINAYPQLSILNNKINYQIKYEMLNNFLKLIVFPKIFKIDRKTDNWIICNPIYHTNNSQKQLEINLKKYLFLKELDYNSNLKKIICLRYYQKECNCYNEKIEDSYRYMNKKFLYIFGTKYKLSKLLKEFNLLSNYPKTYFSIKDLKNKKQNEDYFLKYVCNDAQTGIFTGTTKFLEDIIDSIKKNGYVVINGIKYNIPNNSKYIIQEPLENPLMINNNRVTFGCWFVLINKKYYIYKKTTEIALEDNKIKHRINLHYNRLRDENIKNYNIILKNIIDVSKIFLEKLILKMNEYNISKNEICLGRIDFMVNNEYKPYILEVNNCTIDLRGRESFKDYDYSNFLVKNILIQEIFK